MAVTIIDSAQAAANNGEFKKAGVIMSFASGSQLVRAVNLQTIQGNSFTYAREAVLPVTAGRALNTAYTESSGKVDTRTEVLKPYGGDLDVDRYHVETNGMIARTAQEEMQARSLAQLVGFKIVKGNSGSDPLECDGLQTRYGGLVPTLGGAAGALDESTRILTNATGAGAALSMKILDKGLDAVDNGIGQKYILGSQQMRRNITAYLRGSGTAVQIDRDRFGDQVMSYGGAIWLDADQNGDTAALGFDEGGNTTTSLYVIAIGESGFSLLQSPSGMAVMDLGLVSDKPVFRTRIEWIVAPADQHKRCVCRIVNITDATAAA